MHRYRYSPCCRKQSEFRIRYAVFKVQGCGFPQPYLERGVSSPKINPREMCRSTAGIMPLPLRLRSRSGEIAENNSQKTPLSSRRLTFYPVSKPINRGNPRISFHQFLISEHLRFSSFGFAFSAHIYHLLKTFLQQSFQGRFSVLPLFAFLSHFFTDFNDS